jgi:hypothetical protein
MEGGRTKRLVRDRLRFFNQPAGMLQNLYAGVESLWNTFFGARLAKKMLDAGQSRPKISFLNLMNSP